MMMKTNTNIDMHLETFHALTTLQPLTLHMHFFNVCPQPLRLKLKPVLDQATKNRKWYYHLYCYAEL